MSRSVMYLGNKREKWDNVNGVVTRKWMGPGSVVTGITPVQADKLIQHADEFVDVTALGDKELLARAAKARADSEAKKRALHQPDGGPGQVLLEYATDEQIAAEIKRRQDYIGIQKSAPADPKPKDSKKNPKGNPKAERDQKNINEQVEMAVGKLLEKNNPDDFKDGMPTLEAVVGVIGFSISEDEYAIALGGNAPAETIDKTGFEGDEGAQK